MARSNVLSQPPRDEAERDFRLRFLESRREGFQDFFSEVMSQAFPNDFVPVQPHGREGDWKCDGYLRSKQEVFQVYAPENLRNRARLLAKIEADFIGALAHWGARMRRWTFVFNANGLPSFAVEKLEFLQLQHPAVKVGHCGYEELLLLSSTRADTRGPRPAQDALERYWVWLEVQAEEPPTAPHLVLLQRADLPLRLASPPELDRWGNLSSEALYKKVAVGEIWEVPGPGAPPGRLTDSHLRLYHFFRTSRRTLVTGDSGSGKSTLLHRFAAAQARRLRQIGPGHGRRHTPVIAELWRFSDEVGLVQLITHAHGLAESGITPAEARTALELGYFIVLLDGVDEITQPERRRACLAEIDQLVATHPNMRLVLTSRFIPRPPPGFAEVTIGPLVWDDVARAAATIQMTMGSPANPKRGDFEVRQQIRPQFLSVCTRPLTLALVLYGLTKQRAASRNLFDLYDQTFAGLLDWEERNGRTPSASRTTAVLEAGAYELMKISPAQLALPAWAALAAGDHASTRDRVEAEDALRVAASIGLLRLEAGVLSFAHRSYQEFYAARHIGLSLNPVGDALSIDVGIFPYLLASSKDPEPLVRRLLDASPDVSTLAHIIRETSTESASWNGLEDLRRAINAAFVLDEAEQAPLGWDEALILGAARQIASASKNYFPKLGPLVYKAVGVLLRRGYWSAWEEALVLLTHELSAHDIGGSDLIARALAHTNLSCWEDETVNHSEWQKSEAAYQFAVAWSERRLSDARRYLARMERVPRRRSRRSNKSATPPVYKSPECLDLFEQRGDADSASDD